MPKSNIRLAFREEDYLVRCYLARDDTMEGAMLLSAMPVRVCKSDQQLYKDWQDLMKRALTVIIQESYGQSPTGWTEEEAPEHERGVVPEGT